MERILVKKRYSFFAGMVMTFAVVVVVFLVFQVLLLLRIVDYGHGITIAQYENYYFSEDPKYTEFYTDSLDKDKKIATVYIELPNTHRFFLPDLPKDEVIRSLSGLTYSSFEVGIETVYTDNSSMFGFINGKLTSVSLNSSSKQFRISPTQDGPYLKLPATRKELIEVFGEPIEWRVVNKKSGSV